VIPEFLHHCSGVLAVSKPAGLPTQAVAGLASVEVLVRRQLFGAAFAAAVAAGRSRHPGGFLGVPHRLDRLVSGVLLLATSPRAARQLSRQFERRQIEKTYLAVADPVGAWRPAVGEAFRWRDAIRKIPEQPRAEIVSAGDPGGREAVTSGRVIAVRDGKLLLQLQPLTGRMHQLRLQAAARGLPLLGDSHYGGAAAAAAASERPIALHAWAIDFFDPDTGEPVSCRCPLPPGPLWSGWPVYPAEGLSPAGISTRSSPRS